jgi:hypothetical protein
MFPHHDAVIGVPEAFMGASGFLTSSSIRPAGTII